MKKRVILFWCTLLILLFFVLFFIIIKFYLNYELKTYKKNLIEKEGYYTNLAREKGIESAFSDLKREYDNDAVVASLCHDISHSIGRVAAEKYGNVEGAFKHGDGFCWSGFYHGVIEWGIIGLEETKKKISSICSDFPGKENRSFEYYSCLHGLGHAVMSLTKYELYDSLKICNMLNDEWERSSCHSGVFMENTFTMIRYNNMKYLNPKNPHFPCNEVEGKYKYSCYIVQSSYMLEVSNYDYSEVFEICNEVEKPYDEVCYQSLGRDIVDETQSNVGKIKRHCLKGRDFKQQSNCVIGAVQSLTNQFRNDEKYAEFCESLPLELASACFGSISSS